MLQISIQPIQTPTRDTLTPGEDTLTTDTLNPPEVYQRLIQNTWRRVGNRYVETSGRVIGDYRDPLSTDARKRSQTIFHQNTLQYRVVDVRPGSEIFYQKVQPDQVGRVRNYVMSQVKKLLEEIKPTTR